MPAARRFFDSIARLAGRAEHVDRRIVLAGLIAFQWVVTAAIALHVDHNGWLYYSGGDGTYYWTTTWSVAHGLVPQTVISYGLPVLLWPLGLLFGPSMLAALPAIVLLQVAILAPIAVVAMYGLAERIGGRLFGYAAALMWILSPLVVLRYIRVDQRHRFGAEALPGPLGLTNLGDYPSLVLTIVVAWLVVRALDDRRWNDVVLAGLSCGFLLAVKPSNGFFVPAPICAFVVARRWREAAGFTVALAPALVTLAIWKAVGLGTIPLLGANAVRIAAGAHAAVGSLPGRISDYVPFRWHTFATNLRELREYGWSLRLAEWLPIAGAVGAFRRGRPHGVLLALWFAGYLIFKAGAEGRSSIYAMSFFRLTMPGFPAYVLLAACVVFCIPRLARTWRPRAAAASRIRRTPALVAAVAALAAYPLAVVAIVRPASTPSVARDNAGNILLPIATSLHLEAHEVRGATELSWDAPPVGKTKVRYWVYRGATDGCTFPTSGAQECYFFMPLVSIVRSTHWQTPKGAWSYRVAVAADPLGGQGDGDVFMLSPAVRTT
jgi:hypothetical protein